MSDYYLFHPIGLYTLMEFDFSTRSIHLLIEEDLVLNDCIHHTERFVQLSLNKKALAQKIIDVIDEVDQSLFEKTNFKLIAEGLSIHNIDLLESHNITYPMLKTMDYEQFSDILGGQNKKAVYERIMEAFEKTEYLINHLPPTSPYPFYVEEFFSLLEPRKYITVKKIKSYLSDELGLSTNQIDEAYLHHCLDDLLTNEIIYIKDGLYAKKYITLHELLQANFKDKEFFVERLENKTLQEIAEKRDLSRERVRQKIKRVLTKLPTIEETLVYQELFETYDWNREVFCKVFNETSQVYYFLNLILTKGSAQLLDYFELLPLSTEQKKIILHHFNCFINFDGEAIPYTNKLAFFEHLVFNLGQQAVTDTEFITVANEYIKKHQLNGQLIFDERNTIALADRSNHILRTKSNGFRYYDLTGLGECELEKLKELMELGRGIYSTTKLYKENPELMSELNIDSEYELHNLYKKMIALPHIEYTRMPEFAVGGISKHDFLMNLFYELAPIALDDFLKYIKKHFGLKRSSVRSLIQTNYIQYLHENVIRVEFPVVTDDELQQLQQSLTKDIYSIDQLSRLGEAIEPNFQRKYINNHILNQVNYFLRGSFVLSHKYHSIEQYFTEHIQKHHIFINPRTEVYQTTSFKGVLYSMELSLDVIRIAHDTYMTETKLMSDGLTKADLIKYREAAIQFANNIKFFTFTKLHKDGFTHSLDDTGYSDTFYERVIWTHPDVKAIHTASQIIFYTGNQEFTFKDFLEFIITTKGQMKLKTMITQLKEEYGLDLQRHRLMEFVKNSRLNYSSSTEMISISSEMSH